MSTKIRTYVSMTVEVDADQWALAYGIEDAEQIRADVQAHVRNIIEQGSAPDAPVHVVR